MRITVMSCLGESCRDEDWQWFARWNHVRFWVGPLFGITGKKTNRKTNSLLSGRDNPGRYSIIQEKKTNGEKYWIYQGFSPLRVQPCSSFQNKDERVKPLDLPGLCTVCSFVRLFFRKFPGNFLSIYFPAWLLSRFFRGFGRFLILTLPLAYFFRSRTQKKDEQTNMCSLEHLHDGNVPDLRVTAAALR